jgi:hypothetical protein
MTDEEVCRGGLRARCNRNYDCNTYAPTASTGTAAELGEVTRLIYRIDDIAEVAGE